MSGSSGESNPATPASPSSWPSTGGTPPPLHPPERAPLPPLPPYPHAASGARKKIPISFWVALILLLLLGCSFLLNLGLLAYYGSGQQASAGTFYEEQHVEGQGDDKIALIEVSGVIMDEPEGWPFAGGDSLVQRTLKQLRQAAKDPNVKAVVLAVNSPGGGVTASDVIYHEVLKTKEAGKKIVVHMGDLCASGGYYISAPADSIVASPTSITGSIGVIITHLDAHELMEEKLGLKETPIKSGKLKDILSPARSMTTEEQALLQALVDSMYERFVGIVAAGRLNHGTFKGALAQVKTEVKKLADGSIFTGEQAVANGLADKAGYLEDAYQEARDLAGLSSATIIRYTQRAGLLKMLSGSSNGHVNINAGVQIETGSLLRGRTPRLEYRWAPGR